MKHPTAYSSLSRPVRFITPDGISLNGDVFNDAGRASVLLLHGGGQSRYAWHRGARQLAGLGYRVITMDLRGHGQSGWPSNGDYSISAFADDVEFLAAEAGFPLAVVGASLGGLAAFYAVARNPSIGIRALALVDTVLRPNTLGTERIARFMKLQIAGFSSVEEAANAVKEYTGQAARSISHEKLRRNLRLDQDGRLRWHWDPRLLNYSGKQVLTDRAHLLVDLCPRVSVPVLVLRGEYSEVVDEAGVGEMQTLMPHCEVRVVEGVGHMISGTANDKFASALAEFLRRVWPVV